MLDFDPLATAVYGFGPGSSRDHALIMSVGEAPGEEEYYKGRPFVGRSGEEQEWYLSAYDYSSRSWYKTNVVKTYLAGNPDPTPELISFWRQDLLDEIRDKQPRLIIAVGRFAARFFLDPDCDLEDVHRLLFTWCEPSTNRLIYIIPIYHPAFGFHSDDMKPQIAEDYATVAKLCKILKSNPDANLSEFLVTADEFEGKEQYHDVGGRELVSLLSPYEDSLLRVPIELGMDTEGWTYLPWSIQISPESGIGYVLRVSQSDFAEGIKYLQTCADRGTTFVTHQAGSPSGCMIDTQICRTIGLELCYAEIWDTMYAAYLLRLESKSLKTLAYRWLRMKMEEYTLLIGDIGKQKQVNYLKFVATRKWDKPDTVVIRQSDGSYKPKQYKSIGSYIDRIVSDVESGKETQEGPTDPFKRWRKIPKFVRAPVERLYGPFPFGTLDDVPLERAIWYACLAGHSLIETENGAVQIKDLVKQKYSGRVWSVNSEGNRVLASVIGWHRNTQSRYLTCIKWLSVEAETSRFGRWGQLATRYTPDHRILATDGYKRIDQIDCGDKIATGIEKLTNVQYQLVLGSVLGDGSLSRRNEGGWVQFRMSHSEPQLEYLKWKARMVWGLPEVRKATKEKEANINGHCAIRKDHYSCSAVAHPELISLRTFAYSGAENEIVAGDWIFDLSILGLAVWYQDDGSLVSDRYARIYTLAMNELSIENLKRMLLVNFGITATSYRDKYNDYTFGGHILHIGSGSNNIFFSLIAPFVHPCMRYKLPTKFRHLIFVGEPKQTKQGQFYSKVNRIYHNPISPGRRGDLRTSYCIDVRDTHNFITNSGEVAHNCRDSDATIRLKPKLSKAMSDRDAELNERTRRAK